MWQIVDLLPMVNKNQNIVTKMLIITIKYKDEAWIHMTFLVVIIRYEI